MTIPYKNLSKWLIAMRPWALPASVMPLLLGTVAAATQSSPFHLARFLWALFGMTCLHSAGNIISDIFDFRKGLDQQLTPTSGALPRGLLTSRQLAFFALALLAMGSAAGLYLVLTVSLNILWIGLAGVLIGCSYSWLKYRAFGDLVVFINFALLGSLGGWMVQTAHFSLLPLIWSIPLGLLTMATLHANNWRDIQGDLSCGIQTLAIRLGPSRAGVYYQWLLGLAFATACLLGQPLSVLLIWVTARLAWRLAQRARQAQCKETELLIVDLDGRTAQLNLFFGLLYIIGIGIGPLLINL
jgi:1,4-dihydroxy-2-naphthoate octaprenyltransferase